MRIKDEEKQEALFRATIKVVNEIGFVSGSVSKIAEEAGVSPATLYTYYRNKDDLLISTYIEIKRKLSEVMMDNVDEATPIRDCFRQVWFNLFRFASRHFDYAQFSDQFFNSPYNDQIEQKQIDKMFAPLGHLIRKGIEWKILKEVDPDLISAFVLYPVAILTNPRMCRNFKLTNEQIDQSFQLAWDAIKL